MHIYKNKEMSWSVNTVIYESTLVSIVFILSYKLGWCDNDSRFCRMFYVMIFISI